MEFVKIVTDFIKKASESFLKIDMLATIALGVIVLAFIVLTIATCVGNNCSKVITTGKFLTKCGKKINAKQISAAGKFLPTSLQPSYKKATTADSNEGMNDLISVDSFVNVPYYSSLSSKAGSVMTIVTIVMTALTLFLGFIGVSSDGYFLLNANVLTAASLVLVLGLVFRIISGIISHTLYKSLCEARTTIVTAIESLDGSMDFDSEDVAIDTKNKKPAKEPKVKAEKGKKNKGEAINIDNDASEVVSEAVVEPMSAPEKDDFVFQNNFNQAGFAPNEFAQNEYNNEPSPEPKAYDFGEERITVELADEDDNQIKPDFNAQQFNAQQFAQQPYVEPIQETPYVAPQVELSPEEQRQKNREEAIARMRAEQQEKQRANQEAMQNSMRAEQAVKEASQTAAKSSAAATEDVIAKIEEIKRDGAPLATMKEVALLLQRERAKAENKTPEQQKKLNDALASLLKAMSAATKKV